MFMVLKLKEIELLESKRIRFLTTKNVAVYILIKKLLIFSRRS